MEINFYGRFLKLCELNGIKPTPAIKAMGLSESNLQKWRNPSNSISANTLVTVADYFDVPLSFFTDSDNGRIELEKTELGSVILDEIAAVQTLMTQCEKTLNRLETIYKSLGKGESR